MKLRPRWRKMTWVLLVWTALATLAIVAFNAAEAEPCNEIDAARQAGCEIGQGIAPAFWTAATVVGWFMGFVVLGLIWFMTRPKRVTA